MGVVPAATASGDDDDDGRVESLVWFCLCSAWCRLSPDEHDHDDSRARCTSSALALLFHLLFIQPVTMSDDTQPDHWQNGCMTE